MRIVNIEQFHNHL